MNNKSLKNLIVSIFGLSLALVSFQVFSGEVNIDVTNYISPPLKVLRFGGTDAHVSVDDKKIQEGQEFPARVP